MSAIVNNQLTITVKNSKIAELERFAAKSKSDIRGKEAFFLDEFPEPFKVITFIIERFNILFSEVNNNHYNAFVKGQKGHVQSTNATNSHYN